jgi:protein-S-isoprenylcysteine O-methyltransferase Ste14
MYAGVLAILLGEALLFQSAERLVYAAAVFLLFNLFIRFYEEPALERQFGDEYVQYCKKVGRWMPGRREG